MVCARVSYSNIRYPCHKLIMDCNENGDDMKQSTIDFLKELAIDGLEFIKVKDIVAIQFRACDRRTGYARFGVIPFMEDTEDKEAVRFSRAHRIEVRLKDIYADSGYLVVCDEDFGNGLMKSFINYLGEFFFKNQTFIADIDAIKLAFENELMEYVVKLLQEERMDFKQETFHLGLRFKQ